MAVLIIDGFDKYRNIAASLFGGDWTTTIAVSVQDGIGGGAASSFEVGAYTPACFRCGQGGGLIKTLPGNFSTLIWGLRFKVTSASLNSFAVQLSDSGTNQVSVRVNSAGLIEVRRGSEGGPNFGLQPSTLLATSATGITLNTWHYLEAEIVVNSTTGSFNVFLDGVQIITMTGQNTSASGNAYANSFAFKAVDSNAGTLVDDLYLFDNTGSFANAICGDSVVETQYPVGDASVQFTPAASAFGAFYHYPGSNNDIGANSIFLRPFTPVANCTINSISIVPNSTSPTINFKMVIYDDTGLGAPNTLLSSGTQVTGCTSGTTLTGNLTAPQSLTGGSQYWIGFITDTHIFYEIEALNNIGYSGSNTYAFDAPASNPSVTGTTGLDLLIWGNVTSLVNYPEVNQLPLQTNINYVMNSAVGDEDQYNFPVLLESPLHIWAVKVSAYCSKSDAGVRTLSLMTKSGLTDDAGSNPNQAVTSSYIYLNSFWDHNPDTGLAWDYGSVNNATGGMKVIS
jgi:hypothetical protein